MIYFDNNSTTRPTEKILGAMSNAPWANSNSIHKLGLLAKIALTKAEATIRQAINASDGYILWTSGGAEANHIALDRRNYYPGTRFICPATEHKSVLNNESNRGIIPVDKYGFISTSTLLNERYLKHANTIAAMIVNNETGTVLDIPSLRQFCKSDSLKIHTDAVQALGKYKIDVDELGVDTLALSAHKIGGPKGIGVLWSRNELASYRKINTLPVSLICGFAAAIEDIDPQDFYNHCEILSCRMVELLADGLRDKLPSYNGYLPGCIPSTLNVRFKGIDAFHLVQYLSDKGIYVSMGSACNEGDDEPSHVLTAMGLSREEANSSIRISFSRTNTLEEVETVAKEIILYVKELRTSK